MWLFLTVILPLVAGWGVNQALERHKQHKKHVQAAEVDGFDASNIDAAYGDVSDLSYFEVQHHCRGKGKVICPISAYCPGGTARYDALEGDHWAAVGDAFNEWISVGSANGKLCEKHSERLSRAPEWGLLHRAKGAAKGTVVLCCTEPALPPVPLDAEEQAVFAQLSYWDKPGRANPTLCDMAKVHR